MNMKQLKRKLAVGSAGLMIIAGTMAVRAEETMVSCETGAFSVEIPAELAELADIETGYNGISIREKLSEEKCGGFVASIELYEHFGDYANLPNSQLLGVLEGENGVSFYVIVVYPTDVQFDYENEEATENYHLLGEALPSLTESLVPAEGYTFIPREEMNTVAIYDATLEKLASLLEEDADAQTLEEAGFGTLYRSLREGEGDVLERVGYAYFDINEDGYPELYLGSMNAEDTIIYDMYAYVDGEAKRIFSSRERDRYYLAAPDTGMIREEGSSGAMVSSTTFYMYEGDQEELCQQYSCVYNAEEDPDNPWFFDYGFSDELEPAAESEWIEREGMFPGVKIADMHSLREFLS